MSELIDPVKLDRLAQVAVNVGLNLQPGQDLILTGSVDSLPLVRKIAEHAYKAGAGQVVPILSDDQITLARFRHARDDSFDVASGWLFDGMAAAYDKGAARLAVVGGDPMLLSNEDPTKVARANKAMAMAYTPARERITRFATNWTLVAWPDRAWAQLVFPDLDADAAQSALAEAIFAASRVNDADAVANWAAHNARLSERAAWLDGQNFAALHFTGPGTDLTVGLADGHKWLAGATETHRHRLQPEHPDRGRFTTPHALKVGGACGRVQTPSHQGHADRGNRRALSKAARSPRLARKPGRMCCARCSIPMRARRLGEVALVPHRLADLRPPGLLFYNTLFDENVASHIALGQCYATCFHGGDKLSAIIKAKAATAARSISTG
ncbi:MAG: aminopeptidase [Paracoccaceae bacterium]